MGKTHVDHRVVVRNADGAIVSNENYPNFAKADPAYRSAEGALEAGHEVALQHGSRIIRKNRVA